MASRVAGKIKLQTVDENQRASFELNFEKR